MRRLFSGILILLLLCLPALAEENLVANGDLEQTGLNALPENWYRDMWYTEQGVSYLETDERDGGVCLRVENVSENDARFCQDIDVTPGALYEIACLVKAEGIAPESVGATLSIKNTFVYSESVYDTAGEWVPLTLYGRAGKDQSSITLCARIGGYSSLNTGCAWFDEFSMREISDVPSGVEAQSFATFPPADTSDSQPSSTDEPARNTPTWILCGCGAALLAVCLSRKSTRFPRSPRRAAAAFFVLLGASLCVRLVLAYLVRGYYTDVNCFTAWSERIYTYGFAGFYRADYFCDYPPLYMALLYLVAALRRLLGITVGSAAYVALLKLMPILFDGALAVLIFFYARRRAGQQAALLLGLLFALNPAALADSAAWGQIDSVFTFFVVLSALFLSEERFAAALGAIATAILTKPQALLFAPLGLFALIVQVVRSRKKGRALAQTGIGLIVALGLLALFALVFHDRSRNPFEWLWGLYSGTLNGYKRFTLNAFGLYELLNLNWVDLAASPTLTGVAWVLFALSYLYSFALYLFAKRKSALFVSASALILLICAFGPMIHERYVYPALALMLMAYAAEQDRRILASAAVLTLTLFLNEVLVLQGGMTAANYGHLQTSEDWLNRLLSAVSVLNALFFAYTAASLCFSSQRFPIPSSQERAPRLPRLGNGDYRLHLKKADYLLMAGVTLLYSVLTFVNLGATKAPQTQFVTTQGGESVTFDLGSEQTFRMEYYGGICNSSFTVELSNDGENWTEPVWAQYDQGEIFRWLFFAPCSAEGTVLYYGDVPAENGLPGINYASSVERVPAQTARYVRLQAKAAGLTLSETAFLDADSKPLPVQIVSHEGYLPERVSDPAALLDEQDTVPEYPSYYNSSYFDEIYHARTAYEMDRGDMTIYEWTHPPLGKVLMMFGIRIFGMTPFGWRFMGALAGVLMLPVIYLMAKQLGASTRVSALAMILLSLDSMHFTQTRIATIDSYAVLMIMVMYLFMFRYVRMSFHKVRLWKTLIPLGLCGVFMGLSWATKWIGLYASAGVAILFFWSLINRFREYLRARRETGNDPVLKEARRLFWCKASITVGCCFVFFLIIPALIYYFSHYWQLYCEGGITLRRMIDLQVSMYRYHAGLGGDTHFFRSPWYEWPVIAWPMWYYDGSKYLASGMISSISCMGNPAIWWTGLVAMITLIVRCAWKKRASVAETIVLLGFLSQYLPWVLVPRSTFIYHYFASVPFLILAIALLLGRLEKRSRKAFYAAAIPLTVVSAGLFAAFYPLESGYPCARSYAKYLRWFRWYNF